MKNLDSFLVTLSFSKFYFHLVGQDNYFHLMLPSSYFWPEEERKGPGERRHNQNVTLITSVHMPLLTKSDDQTYLCRGWKIQSVFSVAMSLAENLGLYFYETEAKYEFGVQLKISAIHQKCFSIIKKLFLSKCTENFLITKKSFYISTSLGGATFPVLQPQEHCVLPAE